jgi:DNA-binding MarR family transcriptional regulator
LPDPLPFDPIAEAQRQWRRRWGNTATPSMAAVTSIMRVHQLIMARLNEELKPWSMTFARYEALMLLFFSRTGSLPLGKMGARLQVHPTSVTNLIDGLEKLGYVTRAAHPSDRRTTLATISARGREVAETSTEALNAMRFGTGETTGEDLATVTDVLRRMRGSAGDFDAPGDTA